MRALSSFLLLCCSCGESADSDAATADLSTALDVSVRLSTGQVRAGVIRNDAALFGGIAAEGQQGDFKIYNDRVQFVIQGVRDGGYIAHQGGSVIDADVVRPPGQPGRDMVDEWTLFAGMAQVLEATSVVVVDDGSESGVAVIRATGFDSPLEYINGAVEQDVIEQQGLTLVSEYRLAADSWLLEIETTVTAGPVAWEGQLGDAIMGSKEVGHVFAPTLGYSDQAAEEGGFMAFVGDRNELALAVMAGPDRSFVPNGTLDVMNFLVAVAGGFEDTVRLEPGESTTFTRYYGVAPALSTLTDAWAEARGDATDSVGGAIDAADGPVQGARVAVLADGQPFTLATTDEEGEWSAQVPAGAEVSIVADGRGPSQFTDEPEGAGTYSPYAGIGARRLALDSLERGAEPVPLARGRGWAAGELDATLEQPALVHLSSGDGLPFEARFSGPSNTADDSVVLGNPSPTAWSRDGAVDVWLQPGDYSLMVHRGARWELAETSFSVAAGDEIDLLVGMKQSFEAPGWATADPHMHSSPSPDGGISMSDRLVVSAATGIDLHFGTDHDHIVDYSPLLAPLGLADVLHTVVASEMSPVLRGHVNVYPLESNPSLPNGGAWRWWLERVDSTEEEFDILRQEYDGAILQVNHPLSGVASLAGWSPGVVSRPDFWTTDFDAIEVMNGGTHADEEELFIDLVSRGLLPAPVGVSDAHGFSGTGTSMTWLGVGDPSDDELPAAIVQAMKARRTVVSTGPFLDLSIDPGSELVGPQTLQVEAFCASWCQVSTLSLLEDGEVVEVALGTTATFELDPEADAFFMVVGDGGSESPVRGIAAWAMSSPILVDVDGNGWEPPLPSLALQ